MVSDGAHTHLNIFYEAVYQYIILAGMQTF